MDPVLQNKARFEKAIVHFQDAIKSLRTGRANAALIEDIRVSAYDSLMPINQVASIVIPDAKTILIEPWDKSLIKEVEKALSQSDKGFNPVVDANGVRITLPSLTEENRKELIKILGKRAEEARIAVRQVRDSVKDEILSQEKAGGLSEDERFSALKKLDEAVSEFNETIKKMAEEKEKEIERI